MRGEKSAEGCLKGTNMSRWFHSRRMSGVNVPPKLFRRHSKSYRKTSTEVKIVKQQRCYTEKARLSQYKEK